MQSNQERLEALRGGVKALFGKLAGYVDAAAASDQSLASSMATETRAYYKYHLGLFDKNKERLPHVSDKFTDGILADWMQSSALSLDPGLAAERDPAISRDVSIFLARAEGVLQEFEDEDVSNLAPETIKILQGIAPGAEIHVSRMMLVQDLLRQCVEQDRAGLKPFPV